MFKIVSGVIVCVLAFQPAFAQNTCKSEKGKMTVLTCSETSGEDVMDVFNSLPDARQRHVFIDEVPVVSATNDPVVCRTTFIERRLLESDPKVEKTHMLRRFCIDGTIYLQIVPLKNT